MPVKKHNGEGPEFITAQSLVELPGITHGFFTRNGGQSSGIYNSLNCGIGSNDHTPTVLANRARVTATLGAKHLVTVFQVHSANVLVADGPWPSDKPAPKADAIVTSNPGVAVAALSADCTPVLFADPHAKVVAATHAGWRGAVSGVLEATIDAMVNKGARRSDIHAAFGPCITQVNYQVGPEFEAEVVALDAENKQFFITPEPGAKCHFDLPGYIAHRLGQAGLAQIEACAICTYSHPDRLFSYRRSQHHNEADYGRQISAIVLN